MKNQNLVIWLIIGIGVIVGGYGVYFVVQNKQPVSTNPLPVAAAFDPLNATYVIQNANVVLENGKKDVTTNGVRVVTAVFGVPVSGDLNGDGVNDAAIMLTQDTGGSGVFYYVAAALHVANSTVGSNAVLLGDRIAPQNITIQNGKILANYADRKPGEPMTTRPSVGVSTYLSYDGSVLIKSLAATQEITYYVSKADTTKYCNGVQMDSVGYRTTITSKLTTSTVAVNPTMQQIIKATINAATTGMCRTVMNELAITENNGVISIPTYDAWAGSSIVMCSCKPIVDVNLQQIPGISKVIWLGQN